MLCSTCQNNLNRLVHSFNGKTKTAYVTHHRSFSALSQASAQGCSVCSALWCQVPEPEKIALLEVNKSKGDRSDAVDKANEAWATGIQATWSYLAPPDSYRVYHGQRSPVSFSYVLFLNHKGWIPSPQNELVSANFSLRPRSMEESWQKVPLKSPFSCSTQSPQSWATAEAWMSRCLQEHEQCRNERIANWIPTRLIDIQQSQTNGTVSLVNTTVDLSQEKYITLSHRWGPTLPYCLNKATASDLESGVDLRILPQAYQDAIEVARRLRVRYVWIDSLCIMQDHDDSSDWIRESSMMDKVYSQSTLNISALASTNNSASFFAERHPAIMGRQIVHLQMKDQQRPREDDEYEVIDVGWLERNLSRSALNLRAWVLQERLLAPRVLHFGSQQLIWECHETTLNETYPDSLPPELAWEHNARFKSLNAEEENRNMQFERTKVPEDIPAHQVWRRIIEHYSKCGITKSQDKLIAISGVAKLMSTILKDEYVCGMWRRFLASDLLWKTQEVARIVGMPIYRPTIYRAPSFSWASVQGPIRFLSPKQRMLIQVLDVRLDYVSEDVTGLVRGGWLLLKGQVCDISFRRPVNHGREVISVNGVELLRNKDEWSKEQMFSNLDEHPSYFDPVQAHHNTLFCVPASVNDGSWLTVLLIRAVDAEKGTYCRFGTAITADEEWKRAILKRPDPPFQVPSVREEDGTHVIRLI